MSMSYELMMRKKQEIMYATIKGTLTESPEGVFSGFTTSNYLQSQDTININNYNNIDIKIRFKTPANPNLNTHYPIFSIGNFTLANGISAYMGGSIMFMSVFNNVDYSADRALHYDTWYIIDINIDIISSKVNWIIYNDDKTKKTEYSGNNIPNIEDFFFFGKANTNNTIQAIDLNQSYIKLGSTKYNLQAVVGYTVVGSPTIVDGVVSGFSASNYLTTNKTFPSDLAIANGFKFKTKFSVANLSTQQQVIQLYFRGTSDGVRISTTGRLDLFVGGASNVLSSQSGFIQPNQIYTISGELKNGILNLYSEDILIATKQFTDIVLQPQRNAYFGRIFADADPSALSGTLYIAETNIEIGNKLWFNGQQA